MATSSTHLKRPESEYGSDFDVRSTTALSDYGSEIALEDIDEDTLLVDELDVSNGGDLVERSLIIPSLEFEEGEREDEEHDVDSPEQNRRPAGLRVAKGEGEAVAQAVLQRNVHSSPRQRSEALEVEYDERSRRSWSVPFNELAQSSQTTHCIQPGNNLAQSEPYISQQSQRNLIVNDGRSPIERFRTKPQKPLSVTDLISPAWCELQYHYTLSKFGRKPRTQAMRTGSKIHQNLEDEVHATVPVQVQTNEDKFALRIWNTISGLRCLKDTGLTRELEIWGVIDGQVVNGVIDELSHKCPDVAFEEKIEKERAEQEGGVIPLPSNQPNIADAFARTASQKHDLGGALGTTQLQQIYLTDVKTRSVRSLPTGPSLRPTWMQLMLYRRLLESLSLNTVDAETVFVRYSLRPLEPFTATFLQQIGGIGPCDEAWDYPNLLSLWSLLITEIQSTLPPTNLSLILQAEFRLAKTGEIIGKKLIVYDASLINDYISDEMQWWKGSRQAKGVEIEEAFKCRLCDFAEGCTWRKMKIEDATEKSRLRRLGLGKSAV